MPHSGYAEEYVEVVYAQMDELMLNSKSKHIHTIVAGDFNADIGVQYSNISGSDFLLACNSRGLSLRQWCSLRNLHFGNEATPETSFERWTYKHGTERKQLDYFLVDQHFVKQVHHCKTCPSFDTGSDHRAI